MKINLDTIILFVQSIEKLKPFYTEILQLEIVEEYQWQWLLLKAGNCHIGLHKIGEGYTVEGEQSFKFDNNTKLVFEIEEDIHLLRNVLLNQNVVLKEVKTFDNYAYWICDGEDPEGNVFQLKEKKKTIV